MRKCQHQARAIFTGIALIALSATGTAAEDMLEEIVVTAEKRAVNIQDIPLAVSAFSQDRLNQSGVSTIAELQNFSPNLQFTTVGNFGAHAIVTMRGIGTDIVTSNGDTGVALYQDGAYLGRASATLAGFYDVERVEVLRGPQGTLYGRNAIGGSINVLSEKPSQDLEVSTEALLGNMGHIRLRGVLNAPLSDMAAARITAVWEERDGYLENLVPGVGDSNDIDNYAVRGQLLFDVTEALEVLVRGYFSKSGGTGASSRIWGDRYPPFSLAGVIPIAFPTPRLPYGVGAPNIFPGIFSAVGGGAQPLPSDLHEYRGDFNNTNDHTMTGANLEISWDAKHFNVKSLTAWFKDDSDVVRDGDVSELPLYIKGRHQISEQFSQELTLTSTGDGPLRWIAGLYYFKEDVEDDQFITFANIRAAALMAGIPPFTGWATDVRAGGTGVDRENQSIAAYGQIDYALSDQLTGTLGLRYTKDDKEGGDNFRNLYDPVTGVSATLVGFPQSYEYDEVWKEPTGKIGLNFKLSPENLVYASYSRGFKSGGANLDQSFEPEIVDSWELGSKNRFLEDRLEVNLAMFYSKYDDMQLFTVEQTQTVVENAAKSTIQGVEIESIAVVSDHLRFDASLAYLDAKFDDYVSEDPLLNLPRRPPSPAQDLSGNRLPRSPEWELNLGVELDFNLADGTVNVRAEYHWQDEMYFRAFNNEDKKQESWKVLNMRATYISADDGWHVSAFGKNLNDEEYITNLFAEAVFFGGPIMASVAPPRTWGVEVGYQLK